MAPDGLTRAEPEVQGADPAAIDAFLDDARRLGVELNSFMLWRSGDVIAEGWWWPYRADRRHMMHSATKGFLSAGVGLAVAEGRFALDDRVIDFFPEHRPAGIGENLAAMTVEDLITQTSGHAEGASGSVWRAIQTSWIAEFFKIPVVHRPGTVFKYTSATSFMLSAIISRTTGESAHAYLMPRLLQPLGIDDLTWDVGPEGINPGGNGISCKTVDLLKLAILHLRGGRWDGQQRLPEAWVRQSTSAQRGNAHGYHWWIGPRGAFYAYGVFGQFAVVFPEHDAVLAITSATPAGEETLRSLIWSHIPAIFDGASVHPRGPAGPRWDGQRLLAPLAPRTSPTARRISGLTFLAQANEDGVTSFALEFTPERCVFHLHDERGAHTVEVGLHDWLESDTSVSGAPLHHGYEPGVMRIVAGGRWLDDARFEMIWQFVETSFRDRVVVHFENDTATLDRSVNINSRATTRPPVRGRACTPAS